MKSSQEFLYLHDLNLCALRLILADLEVKLELWNVIARIFRFDD